MKRNSFLFLFFSLVFCLFCAGCWQKSETSSISSSSVGGAGQVTVETTQGSFVIQLNSKAAPQTVDNFIKIVEAGQYNQTLVHEVLKNCIVLLGGYKPTGAPDSARIKNEASAENPNKKWTVAMLHNPTETQSDSVQFLINMIDNPELDFVAPGSAPDTCGYCVFGEVVSGKDVLEKINQTTVQIQGDFEFAPVPPITVNKMTYAK